MLSMPLMQKAVVKYRIMSEKVDLIPAMLKAPERNFRVLSLFLVQFYSPVINLPYLLMQARHTVAPRVPRMIQKMTVALHPSFSDAAPNP